MDDHIGHLEDGTPFTLPDDAVTQGFAMLARRRSGKSTLAGVMEETFCKRGDPWVAIDPVRAHWGIKYKDDNGQPGGASGYDVLIVGGKYGDVQFDEHAGAALAEIVCETDISCVVDLADASQNASQKFVAEFANRLLKINETPRHIFLEEAHEFVPQQLIWDNQKMVRGALTRLIVQGGGLGIGFTLISQRPAAVAKNVLTQIDNLFVLRMSGPHDVAAVKDWFEHNVGGDKEHLGAILDSLPSLQPLAGEAWMLSAGAAGTEIKRVNVRQRETYHAGRTPKRGERPVEPRKIELGKVITQFRKAAEQRSIVVELELDLKKKNAQLQRELTQAKREQAPPDETVIQRRVAAATKGPEGRVLVLEQVLGSSAELLAGVGEAFAELKEAIMEMESPAEALKGLRRLIDEQVSDAVEPEREKRRRLEKAVSEVARSLEVVSRRLRTAVTSTTPKVSPSPSPGMAPTPAERPQRPPAPSVAAEMEGGDLNGEVSRPQQAIVDALVSLEGLGITSVQRNMIAAFAGASPRSSAFGNNLGRLRTLGLIAYPQTAYVALTDEGRAAANDVQLITDVDELHEAWYRLLPRPQSAILKELIARHPDDIDKADLASLVEASSISSAYGNNLGRLRSLQLIEYPSTGRVRATDLLMRGGAAT